MAEKEGGVLSKQEFINVKPFKIIKERYRGAAYPDTYSYSILQNGAYVITCRTEEDARRVITYLKPPVFLKQQEKEES